MPVRRILVLRTAVLGTLARGPLRYLVGDTHSFLPITYHLSLQIKCQDPTGLSRPTLLLHVALVGAQGGLGLVAGLVQRVQVYFASMPDTL